MLDAAQPEGAVAVAEEQTAGRGRMGRRWEAPAGSSLLVSTLLRPPPDRRAAELTLVAGVCVAVVVERATGLAAQIKWPNDVMLDRRKVAGCLAELKDGAVVLGIGINVNQRPGRAAGRDEGAGRLAPLGDGTRVRPRVRSSPTCCSSWSSATTPGATTGSDALYEDLGARDFLRGRRVTVDGADGHGADDHARRPARRRDESGVIEVESGEVLFER